MCLMSDCVCVAILLVGHKVEDEVCAQFTVRWKQLTPISTEKDYRSKKSMTRLSPFTGI